MTSKAGHTAGPKVFRSNDGDRFSAAQLVALADKVNAHLSTLAPVSGVTFDEWNAMYEDFQTASQLLVGVANTDAFVEAFTVARETGLTPHQLAEQIDVVEVQRDIAETQRDELLAALKGAEEWLSGWASAEPYLTTIRAAIAKAEGGAA